MLVLNGFIKYKLVWLNRKSNSQHKDDCYGYLTIIFVIQAFSKGTFRSAYYDNLYFILGKVRH